MSPFGPVVALVVLGAAGAGLTVGVVSSYLITTSIIEAYVRRSKRWRHYSLPVIPWK